MSDPKRVNAKQRGKALENRVAKAVGGKRVTGARGVAVEDVSHPVFSFECKNNAAIPALLRNAYEQAVRNAPIDKIPVVVFQRPGEQQPFAMLPLDVFIRVSAAFPPPWRPLEWSDPQPWEDDEKELGMYERAVQDSSEQEGVAEEATKAGEGAATTPRLDNVREGLQKRIYYLERLTDESIATARSVLLAFQGMEKSG